MASGIKPSAPMTFCLCTVARHLEGRFAFLQGYYMVNLVFQSMKMQTTTAILDMTQGMCKTAARPGGGVLVNRYYRKSWAKMAHLFLV